MSKGHYHLFSNNKDNYFDTKKEAYKVFYKWCKEYDDIRLYWFKDEDDEIGVCLESIGGFPI